MTAVVETTLATADKNIRQFAFDGDPNTYFASAKNPGKDDHFTLVFDSAAATSLPDSGQIVSGAYKPTNFVADSFPSPAPPASR